MKLFIIFKEGLSKDVVTGGYQNKKIGSKRKELTFLRLFKGKLKGNMRKQWGNLAK